MPFTGKVGDTIYLRDESEDRHLYVILTEPRNDGSVVLVNFTAAREWKENKVVFRRRRNKYLFKKTTTVSYKDADFVSVSKLVNQVQKKPKKKGRFCPKDIIDDIILGAFDSEYIPNGVKRELMRQYPELFKKYERFITNC